MAYTARLQFGDNALKKYNTKIYLISELKVHTVRRHNGFRPDADKVCESIVFTMRVPKKDDLSIYKWYVDGESLSGRFLMELSDESSQKGNCLCKELTFNDAVCFAMSERYSVDIDRPREITLSIVADSVEMDDVELKKTTPPPSGSAIKGLVVTEDLSKKEGQTVDVSSPTCYTLQDYGYGCHRQRGNGGFPYGPSLSTCLEFTVKLESSKRGKYFYENMNENEPTSFTFLFDTSLNKKTTLSSFVNALVVRGYVVDVEESYDKDPDKDATSENETGKPRMMLMHVKLLMTDINFVGDNSTAGTSSDPVYFNWHLTND